MAGTEILVNSAEVLMGISGLFFIVIVNSLTGSRGSSSACGSSRARGTGSVAAIVIDTVNISRRGL